MLSVAKAYEAFEQDCKTNFPHVSPRLLEKMVELAGNKKFEFPVVIVYKRGTDLPKKMEDLEKRKIKKSTCRSYGGQIPRDCPDGPTAKTTLTLTERRLKLLSADSDLLRIDFDPELWEDENYSKTSY
jgi:hypothetical protein